MKQIVKHFIIFLYCKVKVFLVQRKKTLSYLEPFLTMSIYTLQICHLENISINLQQVEISSFYLFIYYKYVEVKVCIEYFINGVYVCIIALQVYVHFHFLLCFQKVFCMNQRSTSFWQLLS